MITPAVKEMCHHLIIVKFNADRAVPYQIYSCTESVLFGDDAEAAVQDSKDFQHFFVEGQCIC